MIQITKEKAGKHYKNLLKEVKLRIVPGMITPREYIKRYIEQNGISQRAFGRQIGSYTTGFVNRVLSGNVKISVEMCDRISVVLFDRTEDREIFASLVILDKTDFPNTKHKAKLLRTLVEK